MFERIDNDGDRRMDLEEFKLAVPSLEKWGVKVTDAEQSFKAIDSNGGGLVLFDEFCL